MERIRRQWNLEEINVRDGEEAVADSAGTYIGHAAVFNTETMIGSRMFGFIERIGANAFDDVLDNDVRFLINHDGLPMARTTNGTLRLATDTKGLFNEADIADVTEGRDLVKLIKRKDVNQQSFAFTIARDGATWDTVEIEGVEFDRRTVNKVGRLYDTSVVTYPAYEDATSIGMMRNRASREEIEHALREVRSMRELTERSAEDAAKSQERFLALMMKKHL